MGPKPVEQATVLVLKLVLFCKMCGCHGYRLAWHGPFTNITPTWLVSLFLPNFRSLLPVGDVHWDMADWSGDQHDPVSASILPPCNFGWSFLDNRFSANMPTFVLPATVYSHTCRHCCPQ